MHGRRTLAAWKWAQRQPPTDSSPLADTPAKQDVPWRPPSVFDIVREINAHAGRQATLLRITVAVTSLLGIGPLKPAVQAWNFNESWFVYFMLGVRGVSTWYAAVNIYMALEPPLPDR